MAEASRRSTSDEKIQLPQWEHENVGNLEHKRASRSAFSVQAVRLDVVSDKVTSTKNTVRSRLDAVYPPSKRVFGLSRKWFLFAALCAFLALLALVIGLAVGLSRGKRSQNLPLPSNRQTFTGDLTYYEPALGACGVSSTSSQNIVAVSHIIFDAAETGSDPNQNPLCGRRIRASRFNEAVGAQRSVDLTVVDRCVGCAATDIDVTISAFTQMASEDLGRVLVTWAWL